MLQLRLSRIFVICAGIVVFAVLAVRFEGPAADPATRESFGSVLYLVANLLAISGCWAASRRARGVTRIFWLLFASTGLLQLVGNAGWAYLHFWHLTVRENALFPSLFYRLYAGPMAIALFLSEDVHRTKVESFLDGCIVVGLVGLTMFQLQHAEMAARDATIWRLITISGIVNFILLAAAVARQVYSAQGRLRRLFKRQAIYLGVYLGISLITSFGDAYLADVDAWIDLLWVVPYLTMAGLAFTWLPAAGDDAETTAGLSRRASLLAFNLTLAMLVVSCAVLGVRVVDPTRVVGLVAISVVLFSYAIRCSLMQDNKEKYLAALQESRAQLRQQALYDELTGLPNRRLFVERLTQTLAMADREGYAVTLLYLDLDGFKWVNDSLGHAAGDLLLTMAATRMTARVRKSDTVARMGGDEFTLILPHILGRDDAARVGQDLLNTLAEPFTLEGRPVQVTASIGISIYPDEASNADALIQQADCAMYAVKQSGKNQIRLYSRLMNPESPPDLLQAQAAC